jgi:hypothetical protein
MQNTGQVPALKQHYDRVLQVIKGLSGLNINVCDMSYYSLIATFF